MLFELTKIRFWAINLGQNCPLVKEAFLRDLVDIYCTHLTFNV